MNETAPSSKQQNPKQQNSEQLKPEQQNSEKQHSAEQNPEIQHPAELTGRQALLQEIGDKLSQSRSASGESIEKAVRKLKLRQSHLLALESGHWDNNMPDDIYAMGFLRQYAQYLELDLSDEIHRLKNHQYALTKPLTFPDPPVAPSRRWAWIAGAAFVLLFILFNVTTGNIKTENSDTIKAPDVDVTETAGIKANANAPASDSNEAATGSSQAAILETPATAKRTHAVQVKTKTLATTKRAMGVPRSNPGTAATQNQTATATMHHFRFEAVGSPVWLQVSRPDASGKGKGKLLKDVLLQPNLHTSIRARTESLWITCGNAPALRISVDGTVIAALGSLGTGKKVLRDYRFTVHGHNRDN